MRKRIPAKFSVRPAGIFILLLVIIPAFIAGALRRELSLTMTGMMFSALWVYCLLMTLLLAFLHRKRARRSSVKISPREITAGETAQAVYSEGDAVIYNAVTPNKKVFQLPGILIRCRLLLSTKDGREIKQDFSPSGTGDCFFNAEKRGGYYSPKGFDELAVFDILGFFRFAYRLPAGNDSRLLAAPRAADDPLSTNARAGDSSLKPEFSFQRTDNLTESRPYIPGDDPRRINWKLYGHGSGLFVREGEREPPPHSNIIILVDTEYDPLLYTASAARCCVDLLCENALTAALACAEAEMSVLIGYTGGGVHGGKPDELASALALPAALPYIGLANSSAPVQLPAAPDNYGILILALPRSATDTAFIQKPAALDSFLKKFAYNSKSGNSRKIDLVFFCGNFTDDGDGRKASDASAVYDKRLTAAAACAALYSRRSGVTARTTGV